MVSHRLSYVAAAVALVVSSATLAQSAGPEVTPYRPGVGSPAVLSAAGYTELELGYDTAKGGGVRADTIGALLKYGVTDQIGLLLGLPYLRVRADGDSVKGLGDASLGIKFVTKINPELAAGAQLVTSLPTGKKNVFRADSPNITLTGLLGFDFSGFHADANLGFTRIGDNAPGTSSTRTGYSLGISRALDGGFGVGLEYSGARQSGAPNVNTILGAVTYTVSKTMAVDASASRSRASGVNANGFGVGMTYLFAK
jgi:predicted porin